MNATDSHSPVENAKEPVPIEGPKAEDESLDKHESTLNGKFQESSDSNLQDPGHEFEDPEPAAAGESQESPEGTLDGSAPSTTPSITPSTISNNLPTYTEEEPLEAEPEANENDKETVLASNEGSEEGSEASLPLEESTEQNEHAAQLENETINESSTKSSAADNVNNETGNESFLGDAWDNESYVEAGTAGSLFQRNGYLPLSYSNESSTSLGVLATPSNSKSKRLSSLSMASSIAALAPLIWSSKESSNQKQLLLPYELDKGSHSSPPAFAVTSSAPRSPDQKKSPPHIKELLQQAVANSKQSRRFGVAAQTVADWTQSLDASFEERLGNTSRFQLEVPQFRNTTTDSPISTKTEKSSSSARLKSWKRKSMMFINGWAGSAHSSVSSRVSNKPTQPETEQFNSVSAISTSTALSSLEEVSIEAPTLDTAISTDGLDQKADSIFDRLDSVDSPDASLLLSAAPRKKYMRPSRLRGFWNALIGH